MLNNVFKVITGVQVLDKHKPQNTKHLLIHL